MMRKKGQAAMEFLMTYGWAILVVLAAVAALAYFGVLNPDRFMPEKCTFPSGFACLDSVGNTSVITMRVQNAAGYDVTGMTFDLDKVTGETCTLVGDTSGTNSLGNGEGGSVTCTGVSGYTSGAKLNTDVDITFVRSDSSLSHTSTGQLIMKLS